MLPADFEERFRVELLKHYDAKESRLHEAIRYVVSGPGKLLRPKLVYASARISGLDDKACWSLALPAMLAVEMVHCYSLVHDDLPAMDDDDFRRGRPSCHKQFDEATAILVGDALIADAFAVLTTSQTNAIDQVRELAAAIGSTGMVLGQLHDVAGEKTYDFDKWRFVHSLKTGRLFEFACVSGALSVDAPKDVQLQVRGFAREFGLAFQLQDDLKDNDGAVVLLGKERVRELASDALTRAREAAEELKSDELLAMIK